MIFGKTDAEIYKKEAELDKYWAILQIFTEQFLWNNSPTGNC